MANQSPFGGWRTTRQCGEPPLQSPLPAGEQGAQTSVAWSHNVVDASEAGPVTHTLATCAGDGYLLFSNSARSCWTTAAGSLRRWGCPLLVRARRVVNHTRTRCTSSSLTRFLLRLPPEGLAAAPRLASGGPRWPNRCICRAIFTRSVALGCLHNSASQVSRLCTRVASYVCMCMHVLVELEVGQQQACGSSGEAAASALPQGTQRCGLPIAGSDRRQRRSRACQDLGTFLSLCLRLC